MAERLRQWTPYLMGVLRAVLIPGTGDFLKKKFYDDDGGATRSDVPE